MTTLRGPSIFTKGTAHGTSRAPWRTVGRHRVGIASRDGGPATIGGHGDIGRFDQSSRSSVRPRPLPGWRPSLFRPGRRRRAVTLGRLPKRSTDPSHPRRSIRRRGASGRARRGGGACRCRLRAESVGGRGRPRTMSIGCQAPGYIITKTSRQSVDAGSGSLTGEPAARYPLPFHQRFCCAEIRTRGSDPQGRAPPAQDPSLHLAC